MAYKALYRKYRPATFDEVFGQDHIVKTLVGQILTERLGHAYLFCGTRGTGKTSTAKIFAKAVNCETNINGSPCGECRSCKSIASDRSMNVIEIDAASNNGVDNIRDLRDEIKYSPAEGKYKVYIIDEVHMLSTGAFNAILKTLEEPPPHAIFILATTDPQKIPDTILSRCQRYDFKRISSKLMADKLSEYLDQEQIEAEYDALKYIANICDGAARDALSITDQCISFFSGELITIEKVQEVVGSVDRTVYFQLVDALLHMDTYECLNIIDQALEKGRVLMQFTDDLIEHLRNLLISSTVEDATNVLDLSAELCNKLKSQAAKLKPSKLIQLIKVFSETQSQMKYAQNQRIMLEVSIIKLTKPAFDNSYEGLIERIDCLEEQIKKGVYSTERQEKLPKEKKIRPNSENKKERAVNEDVKKIINIWESLKRSFKEPLSSLLVDAVPSSLDDNVLYIVCHKDFEVKLINDKISIVTEALSEKYDKDFVVRAVSGEEYTKKYELIYGENKSDDDDPELVNILNAFKAVGMDVEMIDE